MNTLIFSKDRACQLRCLLDSIIVNVPNINFDVTVLKKTTSEFFEQGYNKLYKDYICNNITSLVYLDELDFQQQVIQTLEKGKYTLILTDDCVFYRKCDLTEQAILDGFDEKTWCFSFRLGENTIVQNYLTGQYQRELHVVKNLNSLIYWNWHQHHPWYENYGYCMSLDGHIYKSELVIEVLKTLNFEVPRALEYQFVVDLSRVNKIPQNLIYSERESFLFVNSINAVQREPVKCGVKHNYTAENLNQLYLEGQVINMESFKDISIVSSHDEVSLLFKKEN